MLKKHARSEIMDNGCIVLIVVVVAQSKPFTKILLVGDPSQTKRLDTNDIKNFDKQSKQ